MTLRRRILLIVGGTLVALVVGLYEVSSSTLLKDSTRLEKRIAFLEKPFSPAVLAQRVREVLDGDRLKLAANAVN
jgi:hypothetical protein